MINIKQKDILGIEINKGDIILYPIIEENNICLDFAVVKNIDNTKLNIIKCDNYLNFTNEVLSTSDNCIVITNDKKHYLKKDSINSERNKLLIGKAVEILYNDYSESLR